MRARSFVVSALVCGSAWRETGTCDRSIKSIPKGFTDQRVGRHMIPTLASMDLYEQLVAFLLTNTLH
jgi:hypothetical protein